MQVVNSSVCSRLGQCPTHHPASRSLWYLPQVTAAILYTVYRPTSRSAHVIVTMATAAVVSTSATCLSINPLIAYQSAVSVLKLCCCWSACLPSWHNVDFKQLKCLPSTFAFGTPCVPDLTLFTVISKLTISTIPHTTPLTPQIQLSTGHCHIHTLHLLVLLSYLYIKVDGDGWLRRDRWMLPYCYHTSDASRANIVVVLSITTSNTF